MNSKNLNQEDKWIVEELERLADYDAEKVNKMMMKTEFDDGFDQGIEQGHIEGHNEATIEIAKEMIKENITVEQISKITKLPIEEIEKLKEEM